MRTVPSKIVASAFLVMLLILPAMSYAQFGGVVYDPTNYANAVLRYNQLVQQLTQLRQTYQQVLNQYNLALQMSKNLRNMPARYRAVFSDWRNFTANDLYGNTNAWVNAANGSGAQNVGPAYLRATIPILAYTEADLSVIHPSDAQNLKSAYASLELSDGANVSALTTVGNVRADAATVQRQISNLEQDSLSGDPELNSEVGVLNKINASNVLTLRTLQDANNIRVATLEQQVMQAKRQRDVDAANLNFAIEMHQSATQNLTPFTSNLSESLSSYRLP